MKILLPILALALLLGSYAKAQTQAGSQPPLIAQHQSLSLSTQYIQDDESAPEPYHERGRYRKERLPPVGDNVLSGSPVNFVRVNGYACYAFGFTYEHLFGPDQIIGVQLPMHFAYGANAWWGSDDGHLYYATPGLQVHVAGARRGFDYAVGPSVLVGMLNERLYDDTRTIRRNTFTSGIILDNNLNVQRNHFLFGLHFSMGTTFPNAAYDAQFYFQFGVRFGGRF